MTPLTHIGVKINNRKNPCGPLTGIELGPLVHQLCANITGIRLHLYLYKVLANVITATVTVTSKTAKLKKKKKIATLETSNLVCGELLIVSEVI